MPLPSICGGKKGPVHTLYLWGNREIQDLPWLRMEVQNERDEHMKTPKIPSSIACIRELQEFDLSNLPRRTGRIYFLVYHNRVVYVGQTMMLPARLMSHREDEYKKFDRAFFLEVPDDMLDEIERHYIRLFTFYWTGKVMPHLPRPGV